MTTTTIDPAAPTTLAQMRFLGTARDFFRIWIVNLALTLLTLGIYSAWAKVRTHRYLYQATRLAGGGFDYHASPLVILRSRVIAVVLVAAYVGLSSFAPVFGTAFFLLLALASPFLLVLARRFAMRNTSYRGVRFSFSGGAWEIARIMAGWGLVTLLTFGLAYPYLQWRRYRFIVEHSWWGNQPFRFAALPGSFYKAFAIASALGLVGFLLAAIVSGLAFGAQIDGEVDAEVALTPGMLLATALTGVLYALVAAFVTGYLNAAILRAALNGTTVGAHRLSCDFRPERVAWIYATNLIAIVLSVGLLIPWAKIRLDRYRLEHIGADLHGDLDAAQARSGEDVSAAGEEIGQAFDFDFGV
ncbi:MAG: YjgN family protein [Pseudomonadales bacterium]|jgi:uncharacterized membrane protein YjgN (DUF898 family)|nr:YjgN family protein [Pseudomonadales bacterium]